MVARLGAVRPRSFLVGVGLTIVIGFLVFAVWPLPRVEEIAGARVPDARGFSAGSILDGYLSALGSEGRRLYATMLAGDMVWTVIHGMTVAAGIAIGSQRGGLPAWSGALALAPLAAMVLDLVEGVSFLTAIGAHPDEPPVPVAVMNTVTGMKFVFLGLGYVALAVVLVAWWRRRTGDGAAGAPT